jgi:hypothetical protein
MSILIAAALLGIDGLVVCLALGRITQWRGRLALGFGLCDGASLLAGAWSGALLPPATTVLLRGAGPLATAVYGTGVLVLAGRSATIRGRFVWLLPALLSLDNLMAGAVMGRAHAVPFAALTAVISGALALAGLQLGAHVVGRSRFSPARVCGAALIAAAVLITLT